MTDNLRAAIEALADRYDHDPDYPESHRNAAHDIRAILDRTAPSEDERTALKGAAEAVLAQAITNARETEKAGAWSARDRLVALGALDHLNANILAALVSDAILAAGFRRIDPSDEALVERCAEAFEWTWNDGIQDFDPEVDDYDSYIRMCIRAVLAEVAK